MHLAHFITNADLAVDLVNTKGWLSGTDRLSTAGDAAAFLTAHGLPGALADGDLERIHAVREQFHAIFTAEGGDEDVAQSVNELLAAYPVVPRLRPGTGAMTFEPSGSGVVDRLAATAAIGLATFIADLGASRLGVCSASDCKSVYLDVTKNRKKRYCDETCARLESVRAFRKRKRAAADQPAKSERIER